MRLQQGERHRLIGLHGRALVAEIWQHTDANHPSDEDDIVRVSDDFAERFAQLWFCPKLVVEPELSSQSC